MHYLGMAVKAQKPALDATSLRTAWNWASRSSSGIVAWSPARHEHGSSAQTQEVLTLIEDFNEAEMWLIYQWVPFIAATEEQLPRLTHKFASTHAVFDADMRFKRSRVAACLIKLSKTDAEPNTERENTKHFRKPTTNFFGCNWTHNSQIRNPINFPLTLDFESLSPFVIIATTNRRSIFYDMHGKVSPKVKHKSFLPSRPF